MNENATTLKDMLLKAADDVHKMHGLDQTDLEPAEIEMFRRYVYPGRFFELGRAALTGRELPLKPTMVQKEGDTTYFYAVPDDLYGL